MCIINSKFFPLRKLQTQGSSIIIITSFIHATLEPNFQTSSTTSVPSIVSSRITRSASIPAFSPPFRSTTPSPSIFAGVLVTQQSASATEQLVHFLKLLTQSMSSIALPAIRPLASRVRCGPFLMIRSPFVQLYMPSAQPASCIASVTNMVPDGCAA